MNWSYSAVPLTAGDVDVAADAFEWQRLHV